MKVSVVQQPRSHTCSCYTDLAEGGLYSPCGQRLLSRTMLPHLERKIKRHHLDFNPTCHFNTILTRHHSWSLNQYQCIGHIWMWELDYKESWVPKNWCFWTVVLEKTLESPLDCKEIQPVHPKGNQSWIFTGRTDAEAETPILWPSDVKKWLIGKDLDAGKDWSQEEKGMTEDEMVGWHHWLDGHEFERAPGVDDGQGSLAC